MRFLTAIANAVEEVFEGIGDLIEAAREKRRQEARKVAEPLGLQVDEHARIVGTYQGVPVRRYSKDHGGDNSTDWFTHTECTLQAPLPAFMVARNKNVFDAFTESLGNADIQIGSPIDPKLWIRAPKGREDTVRKLLRTPAVEQAIIAILDEDIRLAMEGHEVKLMFRGHHVRVGARGLDLGVALVHALDEAIGDPWAELAGAHGLSINDEHTFMEGHVDGVPVRVEVREPEGRTPLCTWIIGWFDPPFASETVVARRDQLTGGRSLNDPILGRMLEGVGTDLAEVETRIGTDAVRGPLLEILHGHRRSRLYDDRIALWVQGHVGVDLPRHVRDVVDVARALSG